MQRFAHSLIAGIMLVACTAKNKVSSRLSEESVWNSDLIQCESDLGQRTGCALRTPSLYPQVNYHATFRVTIDFPCRGTYFTMGVSGGDSADRENQTKEVAFTSNGPTVIALDGYGPLKPVSLISEVMMRKVVASPSCYFKVLGIEASPSSLALTRWRDGAKELRASIAETRASIEAYEAVLALQPAYDALKTLSVVLASNLRVQSEFPFQIINTLKCRQDVSFADCNHLDRIAELQDVSADARTAIQKLRLGLTKLGEGPPACEQSRSDLDCNLSYLRSHLSDHDLKLLETSAGQVNPYRERLAAAKLNLATKENSLAEILALAKPWIDLENAP